MPELPEVETTVRDLRQHLPGKVVTGVTLADWPRMIQTHPAEVLNQLIASEEVVGLERRAKYVIIELTHDKFLVFHRKMTGNLFWRLAGHHRTNTPTLLSALRTGASCGSRICASLAERIFS